MRDGWIPWAVGVVVAALIALVIVVETRWQRYAAEHHCVEARREMGFWYPVYFSDGKNTTFYMQYSGDRITYRCDGDEYITR